MSADFVDAFWARLEPDLNGGCWLWSGCLNGRGYGHLAGRFGKSERAHRLAWELTHGPIPDGMFVCHKCDVRACANPAHLFLGTPYDNAMDMRAKGRAVKNKGMRWKQSPEKLRFGSRNSRFGFRASHCKWGHEYTPENTRIDTRGDRRCRECIRHQRTALRRAQRAEAA